MMYKLIQRGLPGWFPYNSISVMQPMYTKDMNREIAQEFGTISQFTEAGPQRPARRLVLNKQSEIQQILTNPKEFPSSLEKQFENFLDGRDFSHFMRAENTLEDNKDQRNLASGLLYGSSELKGLLSRAVMEQTDKFLSGSMHRIGRGAYHVDILKE